MGGLHLLGTRPRGHPTHLVQRPQRARSLVTGAGSGAGRAGSGAGRAGAAGAGALGDALETREGLGGARLARVQAELLLEHGELVQDAHAHAHAVAPLARGRPAHRHLAEDRGAGRVGGRARRRRRQLGRAVAGARARRGAAVVGVPQVLA